MDIIGRPPWTSTTSNTHVNFVHFHEEFAQVINMDLNRTFYPPMMQIACCPQLAAAKQRYQTPVLHFCDNEFAPHYGKEPPYDHKTLGAQKKCYQRFNEQTRAKQGASVKQEDVKSEEPAPEDSKRADLKYIPPSTVFGEQDRAAFHNDGYIIREFGKMPEDVQSRLLQIAQESKLQWDGVENGDGTRGRYSMSLVPTTSGMHCFWVYWNRLLDVLIDAKILGKYQEPDGFGLIVSDPSKSGGVVPQQREHKDYDVVLQNSVDDLKPKSQRQSNKRRRGAEAENPAEPEVFLKPQTKDPANGPRNRALPAHVMPCSLLLSFDDSTKWVGPDKKVHPLPNGSFVLFRGDCPHAGAKYTEFNARVFSYFDHPGFTAQYRYNSKDFTVKEIFFV